MVMIMVLHRYVKQRPKKSLETKLMIIKINAIALGKLLISNIPDDRDKVSHSLAEKWFIKLSA